MPNSGHFKKGQVSWNKAEWLDKTCPKCGAFFKVKPSLDRVVHCSRSCARLGKPSPMKGRQTSDAAKQKQRAAKLGVRGPDHWNWRGGSGSERHAAMNRDEYKQWRTAVFVRDDFTCQECGRRAVTLHADHIKPWATHPELRFDVANGRALWRPLPS